MTERRLDLAAEFAKAVREFNSWRFYDCHETLEDVWLEAGGKGLSGDDRDDLADFYQGLIKAAAGLHHVLRDNHGGALKVLGDVPRLLEAYRPRTLELDVDRLLADIERVVAEVRTLGPERIGEFDRELVPSLAVEPVAGA